MNRRTFLSTLPALAAAAALVRPAAGVRYDVGIDPGMGWSEWTAWRTVELVTVPADAHYTVIEFNATELKRTFEARFPGYKLVDVRLEKVREL
jgi:hypothetical protein